tara:strand:+ start:1793 stop:2923 length:1131 start_codon:yes stop_codon:yes gene_type:complete
MTTTKVPVELSSTPGIVDNSDATAITIDSSENVGVGTTSPTAKKSSTTLQVNGNVAIGDNNAKGIVAFGDTASADVNVGLHRGASGAYSNTAGNSLNIAAYDAVVFTTGNADIASQTERMRIDVSGNVMVGKTSSSTTTVGVEARGDGTFAAVKSGGGAAVFGRTTDNGTIVTFRKDTTAVGSIGSQGGANIYITSGNRGVRLNDGDFSPITSANAYSDNSVDLGRSTARFKDLYLSSGIYLGGTGSANHFDDYEEGTWTPAIGSGTATFGGAWYVKIGRLVTVHCNVYSPSDESSGNHVVISGLPFSSGGGNQSGSAGAMIGGRISNGPYYPYIGASSSNVYFYDQNSGAYHTFQHQDMTTQADFHFTISYYTES